MNEQDLELYEAYLDNSLDTQAKTDFEARLTTDVTFKTNFENYRESVNFLTEKFSDQKDQLAFEKNLEKISSAHFDE
ncbi:MAG: tetratricopeptide repeat protein, partial [Flavobacteriaceae bacterium]